LAISARPRVSICCSPPDSVAAFWPAPAGKRREQSIDVRQRPLQSGRVAAARIAAEQQIVGDRHVAEQLAPLGHEAEAVFDPRLDIEPPQIHAIERHASMPAQQSHRCAEQRGLARPVGTDDGHDLSGLDRQRHAAHRLDLVVGDGEVVYRQQRHQATTPR
jgi:hypothetical protein